LGLVADVSPPPPPQEPPRERRTTRRGSLVAVRGLIDSDQIDHNTSCALVVPVLHTLYNSSLSLKTLPTSASSGGALNRALRERLEDVRLSVEGAARLAVHRGLRARGHCDPYVSVRVVPTNAITSASASGSDREQQTAKAKTRVQRRTLFPL